MVFGQDVPVSVWIFSDVVCATKLHPLLDELTHGMKQLGSGFSWTILPAEAPIDVISWDYGPRWKCGFIRLFLPDILTDVDAVHYLDLDIILVSNLTKLWEDFAEDQRRHPYSVMTVVSHVPPPAKYDYSVYKNYPYFGHGGLNFGNIMMNLTRMRASNFSSLAVELQNRYKAINKRLQDQDLLNVLLSENPDNATLFDCTYNLNPTNCGSHGVCPFHSPEEGPVCFCWKAFETGIKAVHSFGASFHTDQIPLFRQLGEGIRDMKLDTTHPLQVISELRDNVTNVQRSCFYITGDALYSNAISYLQNLMGSPRGH